MVDALSRPDPDKLLNPSPSPPIPIDPRPDVGLVSEVSDQRMIYLPPTPTLPPPTPPLAPGISYSEMSTLQQSCPKIQNLRQSPSLSIVSVPISGSSELLCDISTGIHRPLVPESMRRAVFNSIQALSHPGKRAYGNFCQRM